MAKKKVKTSAVVGAGRFVRRIKLIFARLDEDRVTVYAAQSSFYIMISIVPFLMLLLSLSKLLFPELVDSLFVSIESELPSKFSALLSTIYDELSDRGSVPFASVTALAALWLSSRGFAAMRSGIAEVYGTSGKTTFVTEAVRSFIHTLFMIFSVLLSLTFIVFGEFIRAKVVARFPGASGVFDLLIRFRMAFVFVVMVLLFSLILADVSRTGRKKGVDPTQVPSGFKAQLPGASVAVVGWIVYSYFFSLYIEYFPAPSYLYGSLAAVILFMLWLYFCMVILLVGAEINKAVLVHDRKKAAGGQPTDSGAGTESEAGNESEAK